jgi:hypothetical protein
MFEGRKRNGQIVFLPIITGTAGIIIGMRKFLRSLSAKQPGHGLSQWNELSAQHHEENNRYDLAPFQALQK